MCSELDRLRLQNCKSYVSCLKPVAIRHHPAQQGEGSIGLDLQGLTFLVLSVLQLEANTNSGVRKPISIPTDNGMQRINARAAIWPEILAAVSSARTTTSPAVEPRTG